MCFYPFELVVCLNFAQYCSILVDSSQILCRKGVKAQPLCVGVEITFVCSVPLFRGQRSTLSVFLSHSPLWFLRHGVSLNLEVTDRLD